MLHFLDALGIWIHLDFAGTRVYPGWFVPPQLGCVYYQLRQRSNAESSHLSETYTSLMLLCLSRSDCPAPTIIYSTLLRTWVSLGNDFH